MKNTDERIKQALDIAWAYGLEDGAHHKMWVIDQMVRALVGDDIIYRQLVAKYEKPVEDPDFPGDYYYIQWDIGVPI